jgi:hypothetical protein
MFLFEESAGITSIGRDASIIIASFNDRIA